MCIIIDSNCLSSVFNPKSKNHVEVKPVFDWIMSGKGFLVYGGKQYSDELKNLVSVKKIIMTLKMKRRRSVLVVDYNSVEKESTRIKSIIPDNKFNDPHLAAIAIVARCMLICSLDKSSMEFVQDRRLYPKGMEIPRYYTGYRNKDLLCDKYIDKRYK